MIHLHCKTYFFAMPGKTCYRDRELFPSHFPIFDELERLPAHSLFFTDGRTSGNEGP